MNVEQLIRFGFASRKRKIMTVCIGAAAAVGSLLGLSGGADKPKTKTVSTVSTTGVTAPAGTGDVSYGSCADVRAAGKAPLHRGEPGYSSKLDRDGDGVACS